MKKILALVALLATTLTLKAQTKMSNAQVFIDYLESAGSKSPKVSASYFTTDGSLELPFNESIGMPSKVVGRDAIEKAIGGLIEKAPDFRLKNIKIMMDAGQKVLAEYESETLLGNGRLYKQKYLGYAVFTNGKIVLLKEYMNTVALVAAIFPNGLEDLLPQK